MKFNPIPQPLWLAETLRLREERDGLSDDSEACRLTRAAGGSLGERILARAGLLAPACGLLRAVQNWQHASTLAMLLLAISAVLGGGGLAFSALGSGSSPVNLPWALLSLLGLNLLTLTGWLLGLLLPGGGLFSLGRLWLSLGQRLSHEPDWSPGPAWLLLMERAGLLRRTFGLFSHGLWLLTLTSSLLMLILLLSARRYEFVWETTLLDGGSLAAVIDLLGQLPGLLGFPHPDSAQLLAPVSDDEGRRLWASWLIGALLVYGLLPRLILLLACLWRPLPPDLLDTSLPGYARLRERLLPEHQSLGVVDPDPQIAAAPVKAAPVHPRGDGAWMAGIELYGRDDWPPQLAGVNDAGVLDDRASRRSLLERFTSQPPQRLLIACDPQRSADRGTLALLGELERCAGETRIWLLPALPGSSLDPERLADWQAALDRAGLVHSASLPAHWLEHGDD